MHCHSVSSVNPDSYRAGRELGRALAALRPEVVLLFASITYEGDFIGIFEGLSDTLENPEVIFFGGTSDGIYETERTAHHGICALGLNSGGAVQWTTSLEFGVAADSFGAAQRCALGAIAALNPEPGLGAHIDFAFVFADGVKADGSEIAEGLSSVLPIPFLGGLAGDDRKFLRSWIFLHGIAYEDAVGILAARGPIQYLVSAASGWEPVGEAGVVERSERNVIQRISGMSPQDFFKEQLGKTPGETDLGIVPLATYAEGNGGHYFLRTSSHFDPVTGDATMFGSVAAKSSVRVCQANLDNVLQGVEEAMEAVSHHRPFTPAAALVISCAGRRWLLEDRSREEVERVLGALGGRRLPLIGLPSFGEIGPYRLADGTYSASYFHNVTFVVCLFGA